MAKGRCWRKDSKARDWPLARRSWFLLFTLFLVGCEDFGDQAESFVDHEAGPLSVAFATADLHERWQRALTIGYLEVEQRQSSVVEAITQIAVPNSIPDSPADQVKMLEALDGGLANMERIGATMDKTKYILTNIEQVCSSRPDFYAAQLDQIGIVGPLDTIQGLTPDIGAYAQYTGFWPFDLAITAYETIKSWVGAANVQEQNEKLEHAKTHYPEMVVHGESLFQISKAACERQQQDFVTLRTGLEASSKSLDAAWASEWQTLVQAQTNVYAALAPEDLKQFLDKTGTLVEIKRLASSEYHGQMLIDIELQTNAVTQLKGRVQASVGCFARLTTLEELNDGVAEAHAEVQALRGIPYKSDVQDKLDSFSKAIQSAADYHDTKLKEATSGVCK